MREGLDPLDIARLLALQNLSEADASINCWNDKNHWDFWRPWNAIPRSGGRQSGHGIRRHLCAADRCAVSRGPVGPPLSRRRARGRALAPGPSTAITA